VSSLDLRALRTFLAVARHGNFTRAAKEVYLTQPAVSMQMRQLERSLGTPLFKKAGRDLKLTDAGEALREQALKVLAAARGAEEAVAAAVGLRRGRLAVGASTTPGIYLLPPLLAKFRSRFPGIAVTLSIGNTIAVGERVAMGELDLGFVGSQPETSEVAAEKLCDDELVVIGPPGVRSLTVDEFAVERFIHREEGSATRALTEAWFRKRGLEYRPAMELDSPEGVKRAVAAGLGVSVISRMAIEWELADRRLSVVRVPDFPIRRPLWRIVRRGSQPGPLEREFLRLVRC
jgi:DNA-binding transcriptional LysR family regulator